MARPHDGLLPLDGDMPPRAMDAGLPRVAHEGDLCRLWAAGTLPEEALLTTGGLRLRVIYPGRRGGAGGPDFRGAILADEAGRVRAGDVELHLRSRDWITHGHRADPAYDGVVLHVVLEDDGSPCLHSNGEPVPVLALGGWVAGPLSGAAAGQPAAQPCRVSPALLSQDVRVIVQAAGRARLEEKSAALEAQIAALGAEQALFTALLDAAGYSRNRLPCARLAERVPVERLYNLLAGKPPRRAVEIAGAVLLGLAGLLDADAQRRAARSPGSHGHSDPDRDLSLADQPRPIAYQPSGATSTALADLWPRYADLWPLPPLRPDDWVRAGVRPANQPVARLRGVAALLARHAGVGLVAALLAPLRAGDAAALLAALEAPATADERTPLIGRGRAVAMAINVTVPFTLALARSEGDVVLEDAAWRVATALPGEEDSEPLRHMQALLSASGHRLRAPAALEQQGLLALYRAHCAVQACWECPLAGANHAG